MLARILEACEKKVEAIDYYNSAWTLREDITGVRGSPDDKDGDYNALLFYWSH